MASALLGEGPEATVLATTDGADGRPPDVRPADRPVR
jgi:hypothetical protein